MARIEHSGTKREDEFTRRLAELARNGYRADVERRAGRTTITVRRADGSIVATAASESETTAAAEARALTMARGSARDGWGAEWMGEAIKRAKV